MNTSARILTIACILLVAFAVLSTGCTSAPGPAPATPTPAAPAQSPAVTAAPSSPSAESESVTIQNFAFSPASLTVKAGTTVVWTNRDGITHTVTSDAGTFSSGSLTDGASFRFTFTTPGTYPYHCSIHQSMKGTVVVT